MVNPQRSYVSVSFDQNLLDRKLGHEWYGWDGNIEAHEAFIRESKRLFLGVVFLTFSLFYAALAFAVWGFYPRLEQVGVALPALGLLVALGGAFLLLYGSVVFVLVTGRPLGLADRVMERLLRLFELFAAVCARMGVSRDRLGYSLVEVHNELTRASIRRFSNGRILCLGPRCLDRDNTEQIRALAAEYGCDFYMAPGGALARQKIVQLKPAAIIGIACERDLVTGIRDIGYRIPVIGIANKRPLGPCKGAFIDLNELREAIEAFQSRFDVTPSESAAGHDAPANEPAH